ncbi:hypothetical protein B0H14DRAFT_3853766, partial [Mycena olivaceomarginata]
MPDQHLSRVLAKGARGSHFPTGQKSSSNNVCTCAGAASSVTGFIIHHAACRHIEATMHVGSARPLRCAQTPDPKAREPSDAERPAARLCPLAPPTRDLLSKGRNRTHPSRSRSSPLSEHTFCHPPPAAHLPLALALFRPPSHPPQGSDKLDASAKTVRWRSSPPPPQPPPPRLSSRRVSQFGPREVTACAQCVFCAPASVPVRPLPLPPRIALGRCSYGRRRYTGQRRGRL